VYLAKSTLSHYTSRTLKHISSLFAIILSLLIPPNIQARSLEINHSVSNNLLSKNTFIVEQANYLISYSENDLLKASDRTTLADTLYKPNQIDKSEESFVKYISNSNEYDFDLKNIATPQTCVETELSFLNEREAVAAGKVGSLLDKRLISELSALGIKFDEQALRLITKDLDGKILFLEKGTSSAGLQHILERHWNSSELMRFFNTQEEMISSIFNAIKNNKYLTKQVVIQNGREGLEYTYKIATTGGDRVFKLGVGTNGYIVTFFPQ